MEPPPLVTMKRHNAETVIDLLITWGLGIILSFPLVYVLFDAKHVRYRNHCLSNQKQIALACLQYARDNEDRLPPLSWGRTSLTYVKTDAVFQCPETYFRPRTSDYFWNARSVSKRVSAIEFPRTLVLLGDGLNDASLDVALTRIPSAWIKDDNSPPWRHRSRGNYAFADGHVKSLKARQIDNDLRMVTP